MSFYGDKEFQQNRVIFDGCVPGSYAEAGSTIRHSQHSSTKGKAFLPDLMEFCGGVTSPMDKGGAAGAICLGFGRAFDMVPVNSCDLFCGLRSLTAQ